MVTTQPDNGERLFCTREDGSVALRRQTRRMNKGLIQTGRTVCLQKTFRISEVVETLLTQHIKVIAMSNDFIDIVRRNQHRDSFCCCALQAFPDVMSKLWIYTRRRLIQNHEVCVGGKQG